MDKTLAQNSEKQPFVPGEVVALARLHSKAAIERLAQLMRSKDGSVAVQACEALLAYAWLTEVDRG